MAARSSSAKTNTRCELALRRELWRRGYRYRLHVPGLPGRPDIVFPRHRLAIFCDGDFWHGRDLDHRLEKLTRGHNAAYWTAKIQRNVNRDHQNTSALSAAGWNVLRFWETDVLREKTKVADRIEEFLATGEAMLIGEPRAALRLTAVVADDEASHGSWRTLDAGARSGLACSPAPALRSGRRGARE